MTRNPRPAGRFFREHFIVLTFFLGLVSVRPASCLESRTVLVRRDSAKLEYRISVNKATYLLYEPVIAELCVKNVSNKTAKIYWNITEGWVIHDQSGKLYRSALHAGMYPPYREIRPGDSLKETAGIQFYGIIIPGPYRTRTFSIGDYEVYHEQAGKNSTIRFRVMQPEGEEAEALKVYLSAYEPTADEDYANFPRDEQDRLRKEEIKRFQILAGRFPKSVYAMPALNSAVSSAWNGLHDGELAYKINARLMREYPEIYDGGIEFLKLYYYTKKDKVGYRVELDSIAKANTHSKLTNAAKQALKRLEVKEW